MNKWILLILLAIGVIRVDAQLIDMDLQLSDNVIEITDMLDVQGTISNNSLLTFTDKLVLAYHLDVLELPFPPAPILVTDTIELSTPFMPGNQLAYSKDISPGLPEYNYTLSSMNIITIWPIIDLLPVGSSSFFRDSVLVLPDGALDTTFTSVSIIDADPIEKIQVFPNPATNQFKIDLTAIEARPIRLKMINSIGEILFEKRTNSGDIHLIELPDLQSGVYIVSLSDMDGRPFYYTRLLISGFR